MLCTQYRYISYYVERVERVCYVHNIDTFNTMSKESNRLCYLHNIDTFNAMSKGSKDYVMYTI